MMPVKLRDRVRSRTVVAHRAADFGAERPYSNGGDYYTQPQCDAIVELLYRRDYRSDLQINIEPLARSVPALARDVEHLMVKFGHWWGTTNRIAIVDGPGPYPAVADAWENGWFEFFGVVAPLEADHANHAHVLVREYLTLEDERKLAKFGRRLGLKVSVSRNDADWLAKARERYGITCHTSRIEYVVHHLRRRGSDYRFSASETPEWVRRTRTIR